MIYSKKINHFYKLSEVKLEDGKVFNQKYNERYKERKNIAKNHFLLSNAFNLTRLIKKTNNNKLNNKESIPESYYFDENESKYSLNIYNYKKIYDDMIRNQKATTNEEELLKTLLIKIDMKNVEEILKDKEKMINLQRRALKGLSKKIEPLEHLTYNNTKWRTFNKTNSLKSETNFNNQSNYKSKDSINFNSPSKILNKKNNNSLSIETTTNYRDNYKRNLTLPKKYCTPTMNQKVRGLFNAITSKEKMAEKNSNILNLDVSTNNCSNSYYWTFRDEKINLKSNSIKNEKKKKINIFMKNLGKIKYKKDIEKILFTSNKHLFNGLKTKLHTIYKEGKKIPSEYLEQ